MSIDPLATVKRCLAAGRRGLDILLPRACLFCESATVGGPLCLDCADAVPGATRGRCPRCALSSSPPPPRPPSPLPQRLCARCQHESPPWQRLVVAGDYAAPLDGAIVALKYGHRTALARPLAELLAGACRGMAFDTLVPMPLAAGRLAERGFNPARLLATNLLAALGRPRTDLHDALIRCRETRSQAGLDRAARVGNVAGAFLATQRLDGRVVALLDDVVTTGATLAAASEALLCGGAGAVVGLAIARTTAEHVAGSRPTGRNRQPAGPGSTDRLTRQDEPS